MAYFQVSPDVMQGRKTSDDITICALGDAPETRCDLGEVDTVFYKFYLDKLKADIDAAKSGNKAAQTDLNSAENAQKSKWCLLGKARETYDEFKSLDQCLSAIFDQGSDELVARIKQLEQRDQDSVNAFNAAHTAVKEMKKKIGELKDVACKLRYGMSDPCNSEQLKALNGQIVAGDGKKSFGEIVQFLIDQAEMACTKANTTFEVSVKLAGIHAYLNVASLKPLADAFAKSVDAFKADVDGNFKAAGEDWKKLYDENIKLKRGINTSQMMKRAAKWKLYSLCMTKHFACDPGDYCDPGDSSEATATPDAQITMIADEVEICFRDDCPPERPGVKTPPSKTGGGSKASPGKTRDL